MRRAFTLIELIVVVAAVATVVAIGVAVARAGASSAASSAGVQQGKDFLLAVRDGAAAQRQCRRVQQATSGSSNTTLQVFHDLDCNPSTEGGDPLLQTLAFDPATVSGVEIVDNGNFDDEKVQYMADGSLFDTETTGVDITDGSGTHRLRIQLATGGVVVQ